MFENRKDTILLQGALLSAASTNSGSLVNCDALENALNVVCNTLKKIITYIDDITDEKQSIKSELRVNKRLHAAVFFTTLRSHGITSSSALSFYSSVVGLWPEIDLKFYIELNYRCDWSEYFINCASQLPSEILVKVLKKILSIKFSQDVEKYLWHLILQTLILKFLEVPHDIKIESFFHFGFTEEDLPVVENQSEETTEKDKEVSNADILHKMSEEEISALKDVYNYVWDRVCEEINKSNDIDLMKILLHAVKTLSRNLLIEKEKTFVNISKFIDFLKIFNVLNDYLKSDTCQEILKVALSNSTGSVIKHSCATTSWNISESYLCFLLSYYSHKINSEIELSKRNMLVVSEITSTFLYETLNALNPVFASCSEIEDKYLNFLYEILQLNFEGAPYVAEMLLSKPDFLERKNTLKILEDNCHAIDFVEMYPYILRSVKVVKLDDLKCRLLKMFYKLLPADNSRIYNDVLITILTEYGFTEEFQLPDFSEQLSQCFRTTPTVKEAQETFPVLFVQNPLILLKRVIDQTLIQGVEGEPYIQPLKYVQFVCTYPANTEALPTLIEILNDYFEKSKLEPWESKNMVVLYKFLMKIQSEGAHIMDLDEFFNKCIIPKLQHGTDNIELILECICVSLTILIENKSFIIGCETLMMFIISISKLLSDYIETHNGRLKVSVLSVIQMLEIHQLASGDIKGGDKVKLWSSFQSLHELVPVYMKGFLPEDIKFSSKSCVWISFCKSKDASVFAEQFCTNALSYPVLLQTLFEILPHLTKEEWLCSVDLIKTCCESEALRNEIFSSWNKPFPLSENELLTYAVASCLITSLHFILQENKDPIYIVSCFANSLMTTLDQKETENTCLLMTVLLDCCHLIECVSPDISSLITLILLDLKKCVLTSCSEKTYKDDCKKLISYALKCLPTFCDKTVLLSA